MWWKGQNIEKEIKDKSGKDWFFGVWHNHVNGIYHQRIFFWRKDKSQAGMLELIDDQTLLISKLKNRMIKIAKNEEYRNKYIKTLEFPIEEKYYNYFPLD